jgi:hypothetical protein
LQVSRKETLQKHLIFKIIQNLSFVNGFCAVCAAKSAWERAQGIEAEFFCGAKKLERIARFFAAKQRKMRKNKRAELSAGGPVVKSAPPRIQSGGQFIAENRDGLSAGLIVPFLTFF